MSKSAPSKRPGSVDDAASLAYVEFVEDRIESLINERVEARLDEIEKHYRKSELFAQGVQRSGQLLSKKLEELERAVATSDATALKWELEELRERYEQLRNRHEGLRADHAALVAQLETPRKRRFLPASPGVLPRGD